MLFLVVFCGGIARFYLLQFICPRAQSRRTHAFPCERRRKQSVAFTDLALPLSTDTDKINLTNSKAVTFERHLSFLISRQPRTENWTHLRTGLTNDSKNVMRGLRDVSLESTSVQLVTETQLGTQRATRYP